jgi:hypothetical protein
MTDRAQFEAMLEALINEDQETAKEIFHNIVVGKSREIYQELLESDFSQDTGNPYAKEEEEEEEESVGDEEDKKEENPFAKDEEGEEEEEDGEEGDDEEGDDGEEPEDDMDSEEEGGDMEDRVMDLEDALEDLKAEFEQLLQGEEAEEADHPGIHDMGGDDAMGDEHDMGGSDELDDLMEYVIKVADPKHGDNGANTKSSVAGKNDMGGTTSNIAQNFSTTSGGTEGGLAGTKTKPQDAGNVNVPGAKSATKLKSVAQGHGAEKAGKKETADNKKSAIGGKIR